MPEHEITLDFSNRPKDDLIETPWGAAKNGGSIKVELTEEELEAVRNTPGLSVKQTSGRKSESAEARAEEIERQRKAAVEYPKREAATGTTEEQSALDESVNPELAGFDPDDTTGLENEGGGE